MYDLTALGWNDFFRQAFETHANGGYYPARVALEHGKIYRVYAEGEELQAEISGRLRFESVTRSELPAVGDWVVITPDLNEKRATIHAVLPRRSKFSRKAAGRAVEEQVVAANVDTVFLVVGLDHDYNPRRVERYLIAALESGARPVIILSKLDLCADARSRVTEVESVALGVHVHPISSLTNEGVEHLNQYLGEGVTIAFLGSSGAGKSTLINRMIGREVQRVREVRAHDSRGRHTTTHRELIVLPAGGLLIDTPGMRELQLWDADAGFLETFEDVESLAADCRFSDCRHGAEPDCAVMRGIEDGTLDRGRFENYQKLQKERAFVESLQDVRLQQARKQRDRRIHRALNRVKPKRG